MLNMFGKKSAMELYIKLSDGRMMPLEDLIKDYERLLAEESLKKAATSESKYGKSTVSELKVGEWFCIDRVIIDKCKEEIHHKCIEAGIKGESLWRRFEESNKIADSNPDQYPCVIKTYIFDHYWDGYKAELEMREMCRNIGDGMCDEVICDLELQMRICNGELVDDLVNKGDKLPFPRIIKLKNGKTGCFGGGTKLGNYCPPPAHLLKFDDAYSPYSQNYSDTPYAFRRVLL